MSASNAAGGGAPEQNAPVPSNAKTDGDSSRPTADAQNGQRGRGGGGDTAAAAAAGAGDGGQEQQREEWEIRRDEHKSDGDAAFRSRNFPAAIREYTSALTLDPTHHVLLSNRSAAYLSHGEKSRALADARECTKHAPADFAAKARTRLGAAVLSLGRLNEAREAYREALRIDPGNKAAERGLEDVKKAEQRRRDAERREMEEARKAEEERKRRKAEEEEKKKKAEEEEKKKRKEAEAGGEEDDLLDDFFADVESATAKKKEPVASAEATGDEDKGGTDEKKPEGSGGGDGSSSSSSGATSENKIQIQLSDLGSSSTQLDRLLAPNHEWRNLNPFQVLLVPHTSPDDVLSRRYKALSLLLHPDKCPDPRSSEAFEYVRTAMKQLGDEDKRRHCAALVEEGIKAGKREFESDGGDPAHDPGGLEDAKTKAVMKLFAEIEMKRRDVERRKRAQEKRERDQEDEEVRKEKSEREFDRKWREEGRVEKRIGNWRDFQGGGGGTAQQQGGNKKRKKKSRWG